MTEKKPPIVPSEKSKPVMTADGWPSGAALEGWLSRSKGAQRPLPPPPTTGSAAQPPKDPKSTD